MKLHTYLFQYPYRGSYYGLDIIAESQQEAEERLEAIQRYAKFEGTLWVKLPAFAPRWLCDLIIWWKNLRKNGEAADEEK